MLNDTDFIFLLSPPLRGPTVEWGKMQYNSIPCDVDPDHNGQSIIVPPYEFVARKKNSAADFMWSWTRDILIGDKAVDILRGNDVSGYRLADANLKSGAGIPPPGHYSVLRPTGWGGLARPESGIHLDEGPCPGCGRVHYSGLKEPSLLFDPDQWDGSDVFMIWPLPLFTFATARVRDIVVENNIMGVEFTPLREMEPSDGYTPGRLSLWMDELRAAELSREYGIP
ncbi:hypothetical protein [Sphingomonas sp.]|uniref:hypothetical protein n=1 Tax=Sphingomonas sp. TaxID=28214 RepID=UPI0025DFC58E|nr:hypothetical protein [Sphingomonas sp.]